MKTKSTSRGRPMCLPKLILIVVLLFMTDSICSSAFADLTQQDLEKIEQMLDKHDKALREYIDLRIAHIDTKIAQVDTKVGDVKASIDTKVEDVKASIGTKIEDVKASIMLLTWALGFVALFILAVLAAPQWLTIRRELGDRKLEERIDRIEKELSGIKKTDEGMRG